MIDDVAAISLRIGFRKCSFKILFDFDPLKHFIISRKLNSFFDSCIFLLRHGPIAYDSLDG